jgi:trans-AT polyketide synthase/acyltransferase/oxidoreductase domain-containing protein
MSGSSLAPIGLWQQGAEPPAFDAEGLLRAATRFREPSHVVREPGDGRLGVAFSGSVAPGTPGQGLPLLASLPALYPEWLGDRSFLEVHGVRFPYVAGAMANGITTPAIVIAMGRAGMLGFFGAAGLHPERVEAALDEIQRALGPETPFGSNLIHSPNEPDLEEALVDLYLRRGVKRISASAYMRLTPAVVRCAVSGLRVTPDGEIQRGLYLFAKLSRPEVARRFLSPAPEEILQRLVEQGRLSPAEAELARRVPLAEDVTVESDSGGHTDNRPLAALFPTIAQVRDELVARHGYPRPVRLGAAGGLGTPSAVAAAFSLGAAYVLTGSVNQAAVESGLSEAGRALLSGSGIADVMMAPAADMFELGVKVQVLRRGTLFGVRAHKLYETYRAYDSLEAIPADQRQRLEQELFKRPIDGVWQETREFFERRNRAEVERAERDAKHRMALVFRWYLGKSSRWAIDGDPERLSDYQIWCGPALGAFNAWTAGSFLADPARREVVQIARNLLEGAAAVTRAQQLRCYGVAVPSSAFDFRPRPLA